MLPWLAGAGITLYTIGLAVFSILAARDKPDKVELGNRHSKPVSEPAMKELARIKRRCGFRHSLAGREIGAGFAFALLGLRSHSRHSHPLRMNF